MSQATNYGVPTVADAPKSPQVMAEAMNDSFGAIISSHSGTSRPSYAVEGTIWVDKVSSTIAYINYFVDPDDIRIAEYNPTSGALTFINIPDGFISFGKLKADIFNAIDAVAVDTDDHFLIVDETDGTIKRLALSDVINAASSPPPVGSVFSYVGGTAPTGYLLCDGTAYSRTTYNDLYAVCLTTYGAGDGSTTFNVPDFRGRSPMGEGQGTSLTNRLRGAKLGEENHVLSGTEMPSHTHGNTIQGLAGSGGNRGWPVGGGGLNITQGSTGSAGGGAGHNTVHPVLITNFIIKY